MINRSTPICKVVFFYYDKNELDNSYYYLIKRYYYLSQIMQQINLWMSKIVKVSAIATSVSGGT